VSGNDGNPYTLIYSPYGSMTAQTVKALQWKLNADGGYGLVVDGSYGVQTSAALERHLGWPGRAILWPGNTAKSAEVVSLQNWLSNVGGFPTTPDGYWGSKTTTSLQLSLNSTRF
jgi:peptidoglycan hydrolase-like protein with peptidoglycan-binding domain